PVAAKVPQKTQLLHPPREGLFRGKTILFRSSLQKYPTITKQRLWGLKGARVFSFFRRWDFSIHPKCRELRCTPAADESYNPCRMHHVCSLFRFRGGAAVHAQTFSGQ
ncbi:unnamed protein product, partial [Ectocarpus fasciculatus]